MDISIEDKILDLYAMQGKYKLPSLRLRDATKLLNLIDGFNWMGVTDAEIPEFYTKILQIVIAAAEMQQIDFQAYRQAEKEIDIYLSGQSLEEDD